MVYAERPGHASPTSSCAIFKKVSRSGRRVNSKTRHQTSRGAAARELHRDASLPKGAYLRFKGRENLWSLRYIHLADLDATGTHIIIFIDDPVPVQFTLDP